MYLIMHCQVLFTDPCREACDFFRETAVVGRLECARQRGNGEFVLGCAGEFLLSCAVLGEGAHQAAFIVSIFQPIEEHVVDDLGVT